MNVTKGILIAVSLVIAPLLLVQGLSNARIVRQTIALNGFWQVDAARAFLQAEQIDERFVLSVNDSGVALATAGYAREPYATDGLFIVAVNAREVGQVETSSEIVTLGLSLDKRNRQLGLLELEKAVLDRDYVQVLTTLDRLAVTNPENH